MLEQVEGRGATRPTGSPDDDGAEPSGEPATDPDGAGSEGAPSWRQVSHELRTPLHAILGNVELLLDGSAGPLAAQARQCLGDVQSAGHQLLRQVALVQLLFQAMASDEPGTEAIVDVVATLRIAFGRRGVAGEVEVAPDHAKLIVYGDQSWLETMAVALVDLLGPGVPGAISIAVEWAGNGAAAGDVALRVATPGADPVAASPLRASLVEAIVRLHGGRVEATAESGLVLSWPAARVVDARASQGADGFLHRGAEVIGDSAGG